MSFLAPDRWRPAGLVLVACTLVPLGVAAQEDCEFVAPTRDMQFTTLTGGATITYVGSPHMLCRDDVEIWADSAVEYSAQGLQHLMGAVRFMDANGELNADEARYFPQQGRLQAHGHVFVQDTVQGFTIQNGNLVYLLVTDFRDEQQMTVTTAEDGLRPHAVLQMKPAARRPEVVEATPADSTAADSTAIAADSTPIGADSTTIGADSTGAAALAEAPVVLDPVAPDLPNPAETEPIATAPDELEEVEPGSPYIVDGDRIFIQGDGYFRATGNVEIERDSLNAFADSVEYDQVAGRILLQGSARVDGPTYDLVGGTITLGMDGDDIDQVQAVRDAVLTGEELVLTSPEIRIYLIDDLLQRLIAVMAPAAPEAVAADTSAARPLAEADDFELTADSIEVIAPGEALQRIFAGGTARSVSRARDSLNVDLLPEVARTDWLEGDTVIVTFVPVDTLDRVESVVDAAEGERLAADTAQSAYRIDKIVARGDARSLYRLPPADTTGVAGVDAPAVHYVLGDEIAIIMADGEVDYMEVTGQTRGMHLEPAPRVEDSLAAEAEPIDTATVGDTATASDTTTVGGSLPGTQPPDPSRAPDSPTRSSDGRPHVRESAATHHPGSGS